MNLFDDVTKMHEKYEISSGDSRPQALSKEEYLFRIRAMFEELWEYVLTVFESGEEVTADFMSKAIVEAIDEDMALREDINTYESLAEQLDALVDLSVFTLGTAERQSFPFNKAWERVMEANMNKELAGESSNSKRGFSADLVKSEGWTPPDIYGLLTKRKGLIVLEGPDGTGKTTLANYLIEKYNAVYIHRTWSKDLEQEMQSYILRSIHAAIELAQNEVVILDRSWISEFIYSDVYREGTNWPELAPIAINLLKDAKYIFCMPLSSSIEKYFADFEKLKEEREEMYESVTDCFKAYYTLVFGRPKVEVLYEYWFGYNKTAPFIARMAEHDGVFDYLDAVVYDRYDDPDYTIIQRTIDSFLKGEKA